MKERKPSEKISQVELPRRSNSTERVTDHSLLVKTGVELDHLAEILLRELGVEMRANGQKILGSKLFDVSFSETIEERLGQTFTPSSLMMRILSSKEPEAGMLFERSSKLWEEDRSSMIQTGVQSF